MQFCEINIYQVIIFRLCTVYYNHEMIKIDTQSTDFISKNFKSTEWFQILNVFTKHFSYIQQFLEKSIKPAKNIFHKTQSQQFLLYLNFYRMKDSKNVECFCFIKTFFTWNIFFLENRMRKKK